MPEKPNDKNPTFEKALARLETIVQEMEGGTLSLEKMMAGFEEGTDLVKFCTKKLNEVEKKIEVLVKKGESVTIEPFEPEEGEK
jgi:exodeoxyribonuclease VII small subunit